MKGKIMDYKRSNHPDFATTSELKKKSWSGMRLNSLTDTYEFWILGEIKERVSLAATIYDKFLLDKTYIQLFGIRLNKPNF